MELTDRVICTLSLRYLLFSQKRLYGSETMHRLLINNHIRIPSTTSNSGSNDYNKEKDNKNQDQQAGHGCIDIRRGQLLTRQVMQMST
jgi:hypothetical protein